MFGQCLVSVWWVDVWWLMVGFLWLIDDWLDRRCTWWYSQWHFEIVMVDIEWWLWLMVLIHLMICKIYGWLYTCQQRRMSNGFRRRTLLTGEHEGGWTWNWMFFNSAGEDWKTGTWYIVQLAFSSCRRFPSQNTHDGMEHMAVSFDLVGLLRCAHV